MAIFYRINYSGITRWGVTEADAVAAMAGAGGDVANGGALVARVDVDELEARKAACDWFNFRAKTAENAKKREAKKSAGEKAAVAAKVWAKRRANGTDRKRKS